MQNNVPAIKIGNHLIEAYKGHYEDDRDVRYQYDIEQQNHNVGNDNPVYQDYDQWLTDWAIARISKDTPKDRLDTYLEWNGIIGYSSTAYDIATGKM